MCYNNCLQYVLLDISCHKQYTNSLNVLYTRTELKLRNPVHIFNYKHTLRNKLGNPLSTKRHILSPLITCYVRYSTQYRRPLKAPHSLRTWSTLWGLLGVTIVLNNTLSGRPRVYEIHLLKFVLHPPHNRKGHFVWLLSLTSK